MQESSQYATIDEVVALAASQLKDITRADRRLMRGWAWRAIEQIGPVEWLSKLVKLTDIENLSVRKPDDWLATKAIALFSNDTEIQHIYTSSKKTHQHDNATSAAVYVNEDANFIYMDSTASNVDCVHLEYYTIPIDENGEPLIPRVYLTPIESYLLFLYWRKTSQNMGMIGMLKNDWLMQRRNARAKMKMPNMQLGKEIMTQWTTMIPRISQKYLN